MKKALLFLLFSFLLIGCASKAQLEAADGQLWWLQYQINNLEDDLSTSEVELESVESEKDDLNSKMEALQVSYDELQTSYEEVESKYSEARSKVTSLTSEVQKYVCDDQIDDMNYENILDASTIMAAWWAKQSDVERVQGTYRDSFWPNADTKIHAITYVSAEDNQQYVEHFLIYFREFGMNPGVFWVKGQCWLDN